MKHATTLKVLGLLLLCPLLLQADPSGNPTAITVTGARYYGALGTAGKLEGRGVLEWPNGDRYVGGFADGMFSGDGTFTYANGEKYKGQYWQGRRFGQGVLTLPGGATYSGTFRHDRFNGQGRYQIPGGERYEGEFRDDLYHGQGRLEDEGRIYVGQFRFGRFHGDGHYDNGNREVYEGEFTNGDLNGKGKYSDGKGNHYEGRFRNWRMHGEGRYVDAAGNVYTGEFVDGEMVGEGRFAGVDGMSYEGGFSRWMFSGQGRLQHANGDVYVGAFENGRYHGQGTLTYAVESAAGRKQDSGDWRFGALPGASEIEQFERIAEHAIYTQRRLLDEALGAVRMGDPERIELYLLAIGGDGSQEVFRREVEFVSNQFAERFDTRGRTITLVNSRTTVETLPMATATSVRESLQTISEKMNRDQDVLFLFLTSHGSEDHQFVLDQNGMNLRSLPAREIADILKDTGIRWKVVVVSACYSGGFIDPLDDGRTLIITAARHDRTSFGCADENDFTYFGRAFFKDALPLSDSFQDAFRRAVKLVRQRELADRNSGEGNLEDGFSLPQMKSPWRVERHLRRWWKNTGVVAH